jgi:hypothetical protein
MSNNDFKKKWGEIGGVELVLTVMDEWFPYNMEIQRQGIGMFCNDDIKHNRKHPTRHMIAVMIRVLQRSLLQWEVQYTDQRRLSYGDFQVCLDVCEECCQLMSIYYSNHVDMCKLMIELGAVEAVVNAAKIIEGSKHYIMCILQNVASTDAGVAKILQCNGMKCLFDIIQTDFDKNFGGYGVIDISRVVDSCKVLVAIAETTQGVWALIHTGGVELVLACMNKLIRSQHKVRPVHTYHDEWGAKDHASSRLSLMEECLCVVYQCSFNDETNEKMMDIGAEYVLQNVMSSYAEHETLLEYCRELLADFKATRAIREEKNLAFVFGMRRGSSLVGSIDRDVMWKIMALADPSRPVSNRGK